MSIKIDQFDSYLSDDGPSAIVIREFLQPVEGRDGVLFPATFAAAENTKEFAGGYNIDEWQDLNGQQRNACLVDSVGSQANRIEPIFDARNYDGRYGALVPQLLVEAGEKHVSIFEAGHRAGDALIRCSELQEELQTAFSAVQFCDCLPLAKIAPTSLVFGVWDSRNTQAKLPRLVTSTIRAFDVRKLTRSAVYAPPVNYSNIDVFSEKDTAKAEGDKKNPLAKRGFVHNPASNSHGGVIAEGEIRRDATLSLSALRLIRTDDKQQNVKLQRYVLGLAMTAFTYSATGYLRAGCNLVIDPSGSHECVEVHRDGQRLPFQVIHEDATKFAELAAKDFGIGKDKTVPFDKKLAKADVKAKD